MSTSLTALFRRCLPSIWNTHTHTRQHWWIVGADTSSTTTIFLTEHHLCSWNCQQIVRWLDGETNRLVLQSGRMSATSRLASRGARPHLVEPLLELHGVLMVAVVSHVLERGRDGEPEVSRSNRYNLSACVWNHWKPLSISKSTTLAPHTHTHLVVSREERLSLSITVPGGYSRIRIPLVHEQ